MSFRVFRIVAVATFLAIVAVTSSAFADEWVAVKLRGVVMQLVHDDWSPLRRGDIVPDDRVVRTIGAGRVEFQRDGETISVGANSQIQIRDRAGQRFTTVVQHYGTVEVEAEVEKVKHFAVETPFLVAVVKGTRFVVKTASKGSLVQVKRGLVEVTNATLGTHALIPAGQVAKVAADGGFEVTGRGAEKTQVVSASGKVIAGAGAIATVTGAGSGGTKQVSVSTPSGNTVSVTVAPGGSADVSVSIPSLGKGKPN